MPAPIVQIEFSDSALALIEKMEGYPAEMLRAIARGMDTGGQLALGNISEERFTGKGPFPVEDHRLGVRTNRLRSSLRWSAAAIQGDTVTGQMGSNVKYFGIHEFGFDGDVKVASFTRRVSPSQFAKAGTGLTKEQRKNKTTQRAALGKEKVAAHTRHMHIEARAPLGFGIADHIGDITTAITAALKESWEGKQS